MNELLHEEIVFKYAIHNNTLKIIYDVKLCIYMVREIARKILKKEELNYEIIEAEAGQTSDYRLRKSYFAHVVLKQKIKGE